ncbi:hypothetical protein [Paraburkholderia terrae]|uniref:hypothetical protein n=1 Tax=Paraburkholderia terrae TaxID=311230 RepID=UPI00267D9111
MKTPETSLRWIVEKWLAPSMVSPVRVTQFSRVRERGNRYVRVEGGRHDSPIRIYFFRHDDRTWCVFPPERARLSMLASPAPNRTAREVHDGARQGDAIGRMMAITNG